MISRVHGRLRGMLDSLGRSQELGLQPLKQQRGQQDREWYEQREPHVFGYPDAPSAYTAGGQRPPRRATPALSSHTAGS